LALEKEKSLDSIETYDCFATKPMCRNSIGHMVIDVGCDKQKSKVRRAATNVRGIIIVVVDARTLIFWVSATIRFCSASETTNHLSAN
jgi:hypothetical protein